MSLHYRSTKKIYSPRYLYSFQLKKSTVPQARYIYLSLPITNLEGNQLSIVHSYQQQGNGYKVRHGCPYFNYALCHEGMLKRQ